MASSVARMPPAPGADDWRSPSRLLHHHPLPINLRKVLVRDPADDSRPAGDAAASGPPPSPATAARRRQSQILDRWAARQARGMITTIERQAHDAELSALSSSSQPVSARAACFNPSFSSPATNTTTIAAAAAAVPPPPPPPPAPAPTPSLPPSNVKASSLIQMWRELEAESGVPPTPRAAANSASANNAPTSPRSTSSDSEQIGDWDSDATAPNCSSQTERRVENLIRLLSAGNATGQSSVSSSWSEEVDSVAAREQQQQQPQPQQQQQHVGVADFRDGSVVASPRATALRVRGRREIEEVMMRLEQERRKEVEKLMERQAVSRFPHRGRLQSLLKFMSLRRELVAQEQSRSASRSSELDQLQKRTTILSLRQRFNCRGQRDGSGEPFAERLSSFSVQPANSHDSSYNCDHQLNWQTSDYKTDIDGSKEPATKSSSGSYSQLCENSHDSGCSSTSDQLLQHNFNKRNQYDGNTETVAESSSSFIIQLLDNSKYSQLNGQTSNHTTQYNGNEHPVPESLSSPDDQFLDGSQNAVYTSTVDQFLRQFNHVGQHGGSGEAAAETSSNLQLQHPDISQNSGYSCTSDQLTSENNQYQDVTVNMFPEVNSAQFISEDLQEGISTDGSWDERNPWVSTLDLGRPMYSSVAQSWHSENVSEEMEPYSQQDVRQSDGAWISDSSNSWGAWDNSQRGIYHDSLEHYSDNVEIRELLERRRVTTSLASGFRETMNRLVISFLQRQEQHYGDEDPYDEQYLSRQNSRFYNADQDTTVSSSLVPLPYRTIQQPDCWHDATFRQSSSQHLMEIETRQDLRSDIAQIHHEICELRKLVESCMGWQTKLQHSIKQEISGAFREAVRIGESPNWTPMRKGTCCICCEMPIDSLLYRCGHMCTCFKCAHELQWSSGRCPICRAAIVDVVRAYTNS